MEIFSLIKTMVKRFIIELGNMTIFFFKSLKYIFLPPFRWKLIFQEFEFVGIKSSSVVCVSGAFIGMVVALGSYVGFEQLGAEAWLGPTVALAVVTQLAPVITGFMVAAKVGAAYAAEIGSMRVTEQIDALEVMAVDPIHYLVTRRLLACIIMVPLLTIFCDGVGVLMGYLASTKMLGVDAGSYMENTVNIVEFSDVFEGILRAMTFGFLSPTISCYKGFYAQGGAQGVGDAVTKTVVISMIVILIDNYIFTTIFSFLIF
jgi:phospholipid/cholesterol/gamma-HCH transport system permease protein